MDLSDFLATRGPDHMLAWAQQFPPGAIMGRAGDCANCPVVRWLKDNGYTVRVGIHLVYEEGAPGSTACPTWIDRVVDDVDTEFPTMPVLRDVMNRNLMTILEKIVVELGGKR